ncbi:MAG: hypothetical protein WBP16_00850 [Ferruginibacter sp.]
MLQLRNKIIAFAFLLIVAVPVFLSLKFILEQSLIQQEVEEKMEKEALISVSIPAAELVWVKKGKEILLDGKFFDVKSMTAENGQITLIGYFDEKETELVEKYKNTTDKNSSNNPLSQLALKFLLTPVFNSHSETAYEAGWKTVSTLYYSFDTILPESPSLALIQPPQL